MGGQGSGQTYYHWWRPEKKATVEDCLTIDAGRWGREGALRLGRNNRGSVRWTYRSGNTFAVHYEARLADEARPRVWLRYWWRWGDGEPQSEDYSVGLTATHPPFGGLRWWFLCPLIVDGAPCRRRVGELYLPRRADHFGCRLCYDLTYTSSQEANAHGCAILRTVAANLGTSLRDVQRALRPRRG